ncbi:HNH endonuclease [Aromatoleum evansii]|uniref:HNH endonuclease n=1 Tax=Aromatoleum evansii TaxID=59406 RepID=UPI00145CD62B|nr:HNH endonuclease [Aromatoleum evansii]NMG31957.1 restriction endonuclease [Aromatoleum evansii]
MAKNLASARTHAYIAQSCRCIYCGAPMWSQSPEKFAAAHGISLVDARRFQLTAEHLTARSEGGRNSALNIAAACLFCNMKRHQRKAPPAPLAYQALVQMRISQGKWHPKHLLKKVLHLGDLRA